MANLYIDQYHSGMFQTVISCEQGENLYEVLTRHAVCPSGAVCKGAGVCRGCQVYIAEEGMECLACRYTIDSEELHITLNRRLEGQSILLAEGITDSSEPEHDMQGGDSGLHTDSELGIAFDIGTTTIASALVELETGRRYAQTGCLNRQAEFGADVVSRIQYAGTVDRNGTSGLTILHDCVCSDIKSLIDSYVENGYERSRIRRLVFSGNTAMIHFLMGLSVQGMAAYPFTPERLSGSRFVYTDTSHPSQSDYAGMEILILPCKSAFVGGDIVSGVRHLGLGTGSAYELLIDLGTNGELWLLNQERGVCTSTSCGPAFANSVTKGNIHGTSLIDELAAAYREGKIDATGLLQGSYFDRGIAAGEILITQDTVRQIQLAKAAIRTGIELAAYELRLPLEDITKVYLAGGFGFHLNLESAYTIGLFPEEFRGKVELAGNTSLAGAIDALVCPKPELELEQTLKESSVMDLSMNKNFQEFFLHRIGFDHER